MKGGEHTDFIWLSMNKAHTHVQRWLCMEEAARTPHLGSVSVPLSTFPSYVTSPPLELLKKSSAPGWAKNFQRSTETMLILCLPQRLSRNVLLIMSGNLVLALFSCFNWILRLSTTIRPNWGQISPNNITPRWFLLYPYQSIFAQK